MVWMPERPGTRDAQRWLDQLRDDSDPEAEGAGPAAANGEPAGSKLASGHGAVPGGPWPPGASAGQELADGQDGSPWPSAATVIRQAARTLVQPVPVTERPVIGDQLRQPSVWCHGNACISRHADPDALGEADARARAIAAGWREDAVGRLICPDCQQGQDYFWTTQRMVQWNRGVAFTMTSLIAAAISEDAVGAAGAETGVLPAALPVRPMPPGARPGPAAAPCDWQTGVQPAGPGGETGAQSDPGVSAGWESDPRDSGPGWDGQPNSGRRRRRR